MWPISNFLLAAFPNQRRLVAKFAIDLTIVLLARFKKLKRFNELQKILWNSKLFPLRIICAIPQINYSGLFQFVHASRHEPRQQINHLKSFVNAPSIVKQTKFVRHRSRQPHYLLQAELIVFQTINFYFSIQGNFTALLLFSPTKIKYPAWNKYSKY